MTNKEMVSALFEEFFNKHDFSVVDDYISPDYIQHDYNVPPGREGLKEHFRKMFDKFPNFRVDIKHIIEDGDMIAVHGYGTNEKGVAEVLVVDTYRIEGGKLVEHWGTVQRLPPEQFGNPLLM